MTRRAFVASLLLIVLTVRASARELHPVEREGDQPTTAGCGAMALYHLLRLEGRQAGLADIIRELGPMPPDGHSMAALADLAYRKGLPLRGEKLDLARVHLRSPALAYVREGEHGHFLVVRPVGHTGRLIQVLDSLAEPKVMDRAELRGAVGWTGIVLRRRPSLPAWVSAACLATSAAILGRGCLRWLWRRFPSLPDRVVRVLDDRRAAVRREQIGQA